VALTIETIYPHSLAHVAGLQANDRLLRINDHEVHDFLDLQFYGADEELTISYLRNGTEHTIHILQDWETPLGIEPVEHRCRTCANHCIFCFVDQMRPGIRDTLHIKDDDFRLSFVFGNFITLTNLAQLDVHKIIEQRLSPLYISVHTTNPALHKRMLRYKHDFEILPTLRQLSQAGISFHTQIVVVPGWNDGLELERSLRELSAPDINTLTIGIVPVGITKFRESLTPISRVDATQAAAVLDLASHYPKAFCSDEFYLLSQSPIPPAEYYDDFAQLENGIGMTRLLLDNWAEVQNDFCDDLALAGNRFVFVCGRLIQPVIQQIASQITQRTGLPVRVQTIDNQFLGSMVTVTGLLAAGDIFAQLQLADDEVPVFSGGMFNDDLLTIDNVEQAAFPRHFGKAIMVVQEEFDDWEMVAEED
jgi:putative radical SAM enzyme (TIGR03279 family)